jgi:hypothetical protein
MLTNSPGLISGSRAVILLAVLAFCRPAWTQQVSLSLLQPVTMEVSREAPPPEASPIAFAVRSAPLPEAPRHRFWDGENRALFTATAALSTADFFETRHNLQNGSTELNPITRLFTGSTPTLALNFAGETAGVVGLSYVLHKTGHHKLERMVCMVNLASSATAVTLGATHW